MVYEKTKTVHVSDYDFVKEHGRYELLLLAARRAHDLEKGAWPLVEDTEGHKDTTIALKEIEAGVITWEYMKDPDKFNKPEEEEEEKNPDSLFDYWPTNDEEKKHDNKS